MKSYICLVLFRCSFYIGVIVHLHNTNKIPAEDTHWIIKLTSLLSSMCMLLDEHVSTGLLWKTTRCTILSNHSPIHLSVCAVVTDPCDAFLLPQSTLILQTR